MSPRMTTIGGEDEREMTREDAGAFISGEASCLCIHDSKLNISNARESPVHVAFRPPSASQKPRTSRAAFTAVKFAAFRPPGSSKVNAMNEGSTTREPGALVRRARDDSAWRRTHRRRGPARSRTMDLSAGPQILEHITQSLQITSYDTKWIPSSARFVVMGSYPARHGLPAGVRARRHRAQAHQGEGDQG